MKILVIYQFYLRDGEPGGTRFNDFARLWERAGHDVRIVASSVSYTSGKRSGFGFPWRSEQAGGAKVRRAWTLQHPRGGRARRMASMVGFGLTGSLAALSYPLWRPDVVVASSPSLASAIPGLLASSRYDCPLVFEVRDLWPESAVTTGVVSADSAVVRAAEVLEEEAYALSDCIVALTPGIRANIVERGLASPQRVIVIPNGVELSRLASIDRDRKRGELGWSDKFVAIYSGAHGIANHLEQLIDAAELVQKREDILFVCVGDGPRKRALIWEANKRGLQNIEWHHPVSPCDAAELVAAADTALLLLQDNPTFRTVYPNKMFDAMAAEVPVICAIDGDARELVQRANAGVFVRPEQPRELAIAIASLANDPVKCLQMGWNGRQLVEERFDRSAHARAYLDLLSRLG